MKCPHCKAELETVRQYELRLVEYGFDGTISRPKLSESISEEDAGAGGLMCGKCWEPLKPATFRNARWEPAINQGVPRLNSLVKFDKKGLTEKDIEFYPEEFKKQSCLVYLGEIPNMPGHCIVMSFERYDHAIYTGYHTDNFVELTEDEL